MDLQLTGMRALVTGGSRGIGKAIARVLAQEGAQVALLARDPQTLAATAAELSAETGRAVVFVAGETGNDDSTRLAPEAAPSTPGLRRSRPVIVVS